MKLNSLIRHFASIASSLLVATALGAVGSAYAASPALIASGSVSYDGTLQTGSRNITTSYDSGTGLYQITIKGICFVRTDYTTVATVSGYNGFPQGALFVNTDDDGDYCHKTGDLVVGLRDVDGYLEQADFQFLVFSK